MNREVLQRSRTAQINQASMHYLLAGFRCGSKEQQNRDELDLFFDSPRVDLLAIDDGTAEFYAQIFAELKERGRPIPTNDLWLAASALQHGLALATYDEHFKNISGLLLANKF